MIISPDKVKFPPGLEEYKDFFDNHTYDQMAMKLNMNSIKYNDDQIPSFLMGAIISAILFYNNETENYGRFLRMIGVSPKYAPSELFKTLTQWVTGASELIELLWNNNLFPLNKNLFSGLGNSMDDNYSTVILNTPKFLKEITENSNDTTIISWLKECDILLDKMLIDPRYSQVLMTMFETTNDEIFLTPIVKDVFIF